MGHPWAKTLSHVNFGMVLGMSTRKGTAVFLEEILNESKRVMHDVMRKNEAKYAAIDDPEFTSDKLGITAVKIQDMAAKRCVLATILFLSLIPRRRDGRLITPLHPAQDQQLRVQVGAYDLVRGRHGYAIFPSFFFLLVSLLPTRSSLPLCPSSLSPHFPKTPPSVLVVVFSPSSIPSLLRLSSSSPFNR
jgi:hypothetical protein